MIDFAIKTIVRTKFALTSRNAASNQIRKFQNKYLELAESIKSGGGDQPVRVPPMPGVDEDMRNWSFFMILEHNTIVNRSITTITQCLVRGGEPSGFVIIDPKKDVMPSNNAGQEQLAAFTASIQEHHETISNLGRLRGSATEKHPLFGEFDAHYWHCMFGFHLMVHYKQAQYVVRKIVAKQAPSHGR